MRTRLLLCAAVGFSFGLAALLLQRDPAQEAGRESGPRPARPDSTELKGRASPALDEGPGDPVVRHVKVYAERGRFGGWPANHGLWSWGDEILVGFSAVQWTPKTGPPAKLEGAGADPAPSEGGDLAGWAARWVPRPTRPLRHPGRHRYGFALDRRLQSMLPAAVAYPKILAA